ncbi:Gfo/Idh/MocA family protein [Lederbergia citrea]|uniref:Gfo/Idh/MocA family oxidoreductase n=1 Tax=Lederbergia citrea TaxID=2833581 RepID=A0A942Z5H6_9BACI|nr:Gfo/Idh/MocA family oxidoreductase [Lederbergia citrea]MBS4205207.1 Gfo/Idh/MocA family oxidoreductase [Lederbergia citrea]MBS4222931.1 Gfo/Idh/MocA family oxidoreductase [Lederbergia citrea]
MVKIALVGTGWQGQGHLATLKELENVHLVGVCDLNEEMLQKATSKFGIKGFNNYVNMLEETKPEGVIICTPPEIRENLVREAAERGIHCFIEKPPARNIDSAKKVVSILEKTGVINSVGFMYRYSPAVEYTKQIIQGKRIALVRSAMLDGLALRPNWPRWFFDKERSGGPVFDQAIHIFDLCRYLLGEVDRVTGYQDNLVVPKADDFTVEDSLTLSMKYKNGILQNHLHSWSYPDVFTQIELYSDELNLTLDLVKGRVSGQVDGEVVFFESNEDPLYRLELEAFIKAISENNPKLILSSYKDSILSLSFAIKAMEALEN